MVVAAKTHDIIAPSVGVLHSSVVPCSDVECDGSSCISVQVYHGQFMELIMYLCFTPQKSRGLFPGEIGRLNWCWCMIHYYLM